MLIKLCPGGGQPGAVQCGHAVLPAGAVGFPKEISADTAGSETQGACCCF